MTKKNATEPTIVHIDPAKGLSPKQIDVIRAATGWKMKDLFEDDVLTGKGIAGRLWLLIRETRPDVTPEQVYDADDLSRFGIELVGDEPSPDVEAEAKDPTNAAG